MPEDDDLINIQERQARERDERRKQRQLKVWEKGVNKDRAGALRWIDEIQAEGAEGPITVAEAAQAALVTDRVRAKESVQKTIEKKREMFLLQMQIDIKKEEIKKIEQFGQLREYGLKNSEDMLIDDMNKFNEYWDDCKRQSHDAMKEVKRLNKEKLELTHETNKLNEEIQQLHNQLQKHDETLKEYSRYKNFLSEVIPAARDDAFPSANKLLSTFDTYVENNLVLIQNIQDIEQDLEHVRQDFAKNEHRLNAKLDDLKSRKQELQKLIDGKRKVNAQLEERLFKSQHEQVSSTLLGKLHDSIKECTRAFRGNTENQQEPLEMLEDIENVLDKFQRIFEELDPLRKGESLEGKELAKVCRDLRELRRNQSRLESKEADRLNDEKARKYKERAMLPVQRKLGRKPMARTRVPEKRQKAVVEEIPQEVLDRREFLEDDA